MRARAARFLLVAVELAALGSAAVAAPALRLLRPLGARRGTTFTLTVVGRELQPGSELVTTLPATITRLAPQRDLRTPDSELPFLVELGRDAPVGLYPVRLRTQDGLSNLLLFSVGDLPEIENRKEDLERKPRSSAPARPITPPVVVSSTLGEAERDAYRFQARAGASLIFEVEARRLGSAIDPVVRIEDGGGHEIASSDDAPGIGADSRVEVRFPRDGDYRVIVHDSRYSAQEANFYRLKVGSYPYADSVFPLGWRRGGEVDFTLSGGNLAKPVTVRQRVDAPASSTTSLVRLPLRPGSGEGPPLRIVVGDRPESLEPDGEGPHPLQADTVVNGRISRPGEVDRYRLPVHAGERWLFEVEAARLETTRMGAYLSLRDASGKLLASAVDAGGLNVQKEFSFTPPEKGVDPKLLFQVPGDVDQLVVSVEEINRGGGPAYAYRLRATRSYEEFTLEVAPAFVNVPAGGSSTIPVRVVRDTYSGPIRLSIANAGAALRVEGGHVPAGVREGLLVVTASGDPSAAPATLEIWGEGKSASGAPIRRRATAPGLVTPVRGSRREVSARWLGMELPMTVAGRAPLTLDPADREIKLVQGLKYDLALKVARNAPLAAPIRIEGVRPGTIDVAVRAAELDPKAVSIGIEISAGVTAGIGRFDLVLQARIDPGPREVVVTSPPIAVDVVRAFAVAADATALELGRNATVELAGKIRRQYPYREAVGLRVEDLPLDVACEAIEVPSSESAFRLVFRAGPSVEPGEYTLRLVAAGKMEGRKETKDYTVPDTPLRLKITRGGVPSSAVKGP